MFSIIKRLFQRDSGKNFRAEASPEPVVKIETTEAEIPKKTADVDGAPPGGTLRKTAVPRPTPPRRRKKASSRSGKPEQPPPSCNRYGIAVFKKDADIARLFENRPKEKTGGDEPQSRKVVPTPSRKVRRRSRNKNGIPLFGEDTDFSAYFRDPKPGGMVPEKTIRKNGRPTPEPEDFKTLLENALAGKTMEVLLREKNDERPGETPKTPDQVIRNYPPPQEELDLHGHTAQEAIERTRAFIEKSRYRGKRTLLVIVGKGLHSEGKAILPDVVEAELARLRQEGKVLAHRWEKGAKRKSGAIVVYLNSM